MRKKIVSFLISGLFAVSLTACSSSGVSQEEYDKVVAERDSLQEQLDALTGGSEEESDSEPQDQESDTEEFQVGETWEVEGLFRVTVNSVQETSERNEFDTSTPGAVYMITYTYENLGLEQELYVDMESKIVDSTGKMGTSYPGDISMYPQNVPIGANCEAQACIAVDNSGTFKDYVEIYDDDFNSYNAIFNLSAS